jgi:Xaa-Pro aminopeptidase
MELSKKLTMIRNEMQKNGVDIYIVPSIDAHNSEYVPVHWQRRPWISNFTGSAGEAVITMDHAYLWTDGRYYSQANKELNPKEYTLMKQSGFMPEVEAWAQDNAHGKTLAIDSRLTSIDRAKSLKAAITKVSGSVIFSANNLVDVCKEKLGEKLELPNDMIYKLEDSYTGKSVQDKINLIKQDLTKANTDYILLNVLDEIAWLFNIRGQDVSFNPLVISYAIIGQKNTKLFINLDKIPDDLKSELKSLDIELYNYNAFGEEVTKLRGQIWLDGKTANFWMLDNVDKSCKVTYKRSPIVMYKAIKNQTEQNGTKHAHIKDAVAVIGFLNWISNNWQSGIDELIAENKLHEFRSKQKNLKGESFSTISGFAGNGAVIHYRANELTNKTIDDSNIYLVDSGGQYLEGTTDITRTIHLGNPTTIQKRHYTLVLKGHLALARQKFPIGTNGEHLDALARQYLWNDYLDYRHGTGHGVGSFLCVHEGPQKISKGLSGTPLQGGMIVSNEPGFYLEGEYGIRIENLCLINETLNINGKQSEFGPFLEFEDLTLVPYCKKLIDLSLLDETEKKQIAEYYKKIKDKVEPLLNNEDKTWFNNEINLDF